MTLSPTTTPSSSVKPHSYQSTTPSTLSSTPIASNHHLHNTSITFNSTTLITLTPPFLSIPSNTSSLLTITITPPSRSSPPSSTLPTRLALQRYIQILDSISNTYTISFTAQSATSPSNPPPRNNPSPSLHLPLSLLSQNTTTRPTLPTPLTFNRTDDMMTINLHLRLPSPLTRIFIYTSKNVSAEVLMKRTQASVGASTFPEDAVAASPATKLRRMRGRMGR
ncbi:hypothetical protein BC829DRAFT_247488 [Chytridium lagenaria]|nr:hypothetical protein BC829DRAFT_247488 [Chytridium lagenaria]